MNSELLTHTIPSETEKQEIAGRMYEALDIARAIECGQVTTLDEILALVKSSAINLGKALECDKWVYSNCCLDINASIDLSFKHTNEAR
ncbi:TPA: hypothetical protein I9281_004812 [Serratia marcescens]|uniref:hypothetical protein n=1 Tax=Enterobacter hormaechei TaxID=158836 RepID=UPI001A2470B2|nr:hypothetical protein [Enterobacter hormaechei]HAT4519819.1 hypothetical protein [Serratia marcescens]